MARIVSIWRIEFVRPSGAALRLLDFGERMEGEPKLGSAQEAAAHAAVAAVWGSNHALGGAQRAMSWTREQQHASPAAARGFCVGHPAVMPYGETGKFRVEIQDGGVWEIRSAVVLDAVTVPLEKVPHKTLTTYQARGVGAVPVSEVALFPGMPPAWIHQAPAAIPTAPADM